MEILPLDQVFEHIGGSDTVRALVDEFYDKVKLDKLLRPLFPENLEDGKRRQFLFLMQIFGGPREYEGERGHARLRRRHMPFRIGIEERNRWYQLMLVSMKKVGITQDHPAYAAMDTYFAHTSMKMINSADYAHPLGLKS